MSYKVIPDTKFSIEVLDESEFNFPENIKFYWEDEKVYVKIKHNEIDRDGLELRFNINDDKPVLEVDRDIDGLDFSGFREDFIEVLKKLVSLL